MFPICFQQNIPGHFYFFGPSNMLYVFNKIFLAIFLAPQICYMFSTKYSWPFFGPSNMLYVFNKIFLAISLPIRYALCLQQNIPSHFIWPLKYAICFQQNIPGHFFGPSNMLYVFNKKSLAMFNAHQTCSMFPTKYSWQYSKTTEYSLYFQPNILGYVLPNLLNICFLIFSYFTIHQWTPLSVAIPALYDTHLTLFFLTFFVIKMPIKNREQCL